MWKTLVLGLLGSFISFTASAQTAEELIPFEKLPVTLRKELWTVTKRYTVRRKVKEQTVNCKESTFHYLLTRLPMASRLVRKMDLGKYKIEDRPGNAFSIDDDAGAFANCNIVFQESNRIVIVARGFIDTGIFPKVHGTGVIIIRTKTVKGAAKDSIQADCRVYFRLTDRTLHQVSKAFRKTLGRVIERRLLMFVECARKVAEQISQNPKKVAKTLSELKEPKAVTDDFNKRFPS